MLNSSQSAFALEVNYFFKTGDVSSVESSSLPQEDGVFAIVEKNSKYFFVKGKLEDKSWKTKDDIENGLMHRRIKFTPSGQNLEPINRFIFFGKDSDTTVKVFDWDVECSNPFPVKKLIKSNYDDFKERTKDVENGFGGPGLITSYESQTSSFTCGLNTGEDYFKVTDIELPNFPGFMWNEIQLTFKSKNTGKIIKLPNFSTIEFVGDINGDGIPDFITHMQTHESGSNEDVLHMSTKEKESDGSIKYSRFTINELGC